MDITCDAKSTESEDSHASLPQNMMKLVFFKSLARQIMLPGNTGFYCHYNLCQVVMKSFSSLPYRNKFAEWHVYH